MARKELEQALNKKIFLELEVEFDKHWVERV
jgi:GTPase Era involved in 16S rRNA processing